MWNKIKLFAKANPKLAIFSIFMDMFIIGIIIKHGVVNGLIIIGVIGMIIIGIMMIVKWLEG